MHRAAASVDVVSVGRGVNRLDVGAQGSQALRPRPVGGTVGRVDHDAQALEVAPFDAGGHRPDMTAQGLLARIFTGGRARLHRRVGGRQVRTRGETALDLALGLVIELAPAGGEQLHSVVVP